MRELRRLLIDRRRLEKTLDINNFLFLKEDEKHYLSRVLRLKQGSLVNVVDGLGHLWEARFDEINTIQLTSTFDEPLIKQSRPNTLICLAVVLPKRGFEDILRMGCEIGVDIFQPLDSDRRVSKGDSEDKFSRWNSILQEAVEQSERLWMPELRRTLHFENWLIDSSPTSAVAIATTRSKKSREFQLWMESLQKGVEQVWVAIGPEGGWSELEIDLVIKEDCASISYGENILRTSTAAISASQLMVNWRRVSNSFEN